MLLTENIFWLQERLFGTSEFSKKSTNRQCWNGESQGSYTENIVLDGIVNVLKNPELEIRNGRLPEPPLFRNQINKLNTITQQLRSAYNGQAVQWWDEVNFQKL